MKQEADKHAPKVPDLFEPPPWPERHHDLRAIGRNWTSHALVDKRLDRADGYQRAAEILADHILTHRSDLDSVVFPFAACWRHYVELQLKRALMDLRRLLDVPVVEEQHHDVLQLWNKVRPLLVRAHPDESRRDRSIVGRVLRQLAQLDPLGEDFRYAKRRDGSVTLAGLDRLDVHAFHDAMQAVANYLEGLLDKTGDYLSDYLDLKSEYEDEMREMSDEY